MSVAFSAIQNETPSVTWEPTQCRTIYGSFDIYGLRKACSGSVSGRFQSPVIDGGVWRFCVELQQNLATSTDAQRSVQLILCMASRSQSSRHHSSGHFEFSARAFVGDVQIAEYHTASHKYSQGDSVQIDEFLSARDLLDMPELEENDTVTIEYDISERPRDLHKRPLGLDPAPYAPIAQATAALFDDPYTADVVFVIRHPSASHPRPRRIYAHTKFLGVRCDWFAQKFAGAHQYHLSYHTHDPLDTSANIPDLSASTDAAPDLRWENGSDSDWEDEESEDESPELADEEDLYEAPRTRPTNANEDTPPPSATRRARLGISLADTIAEEDSADDERGSIDVDDVTRVDPASTSRSTFARAKRLAASTTALPKVHVEDVSPEASAGEEDADPMPGRQRRLIEISDVSYRTFRTFLFYLYTGSVAFAPLRSTYRAARAAARATGERGPFVKRVDFNEMNATRLGAELEGHENVWASAKSVFWMCDRYGMPELQDAALQHLRLAITPENVADEVCSSFSRTYPDIRREQSEFLKAHWAEASATPGFRTLFMRLFEGGGGRGGAAAGELWVDLLAQLRMPTGQEEGEEDEEVL